MKEKIFKKLEDHDKRFDQHDKKFDQIDKRFDRLEYQVDFIAGKVLEHDERLENIEENMATKDDIAGITTTLDKLVGLVKKKDQELVFINQRLKRVEDKCL